MELQAFEWSIFSVFVTVLHCRGLCTYFFFSRMRVNFGEVIFAVECEE